jgi:hypothetical protein
MDSTAMATSVAASPLFKLPAELRLRIYEYALRSDKPAYVGFYRKNGHCTVTRANGIPEPALLFTCKAVREEAIKTFYTVNVFGATVENCHPAAHIIMARKKAILQAMGMDVTKIAVQTSQFGLKNFQNLMLWLQYIHQGGMIPSVTYATSIVSRKAKLRSTARFMSSLTNIATAMRGSPWAEVENIIKGLRLGLIAFDDEWQEDA